MKTINVISQTARKVDAKRKHPNIFTKLFGRPFAMGRHLHSLSAQMNSEHSFSIASFLSEVHSHLREVNSVSLFLTSTSGTSSLEHYATIETNGKKSEISFEHFNVPTANDSLLANAMKSDNGGKGFFFNEKTGRIRSFSLSKDDFKIGKITTEKTKDGSKYIIIPLRASDSERVLGCLVIKGSDLRLKNRMFMLSSLAFLATSSRLLFSLIDRHLDPLTKLMTRNVMLHSLHTNAERFLRNPEDTDNNFSFVMCDLDDFKRINDDPEGGHQVGDQKLREVATVLKTNSRSTKVIHEDNKREKPSKSDLVARMGGEEFGIMLANISSAVALSVSSRFRKQIKSNIESLHGERLTGSFGVADASTILHLWDNGLIDLEEVKSKVQGFSRMPKHQQFAELMIFMADKAAYHAKNTGKDRVCFVANVNQAESIFGTFESS